ncbi:hypothetical protein LS70_009685 [Helicobacter sp. MIT 11-5569]|uniref:hypothetical protein n=1 Tax=Helicobacter sp. MIT 11-5569 TaxID=1548151 RepID=UPI00051FB9FE|nr:hypothetical protein [Helicobacter sp. MIT 11-5569]TLD79728.1 hypothetical protein LS70_009685 [Helicobacter sp. MIT 11-5569]
MKFKNIKYGILFEREFYLQDTKIDLRNDFSVCAIKTHEKTLEIIFKSTKKHIQDLKIIFFNHKLLHLKAYCDSFDNIEANFVDIIRNNWDDTTDYIEKENEMLLTMYFDNDLEYITLTCEYFDINFIDYQ